MSMDTTHQAPDLSRRWLSLAAVPLCGLIGLMLLPGGIYAQRQLPGTVRMSTWCMLIAAISSFLMLILKTCFDAWCQATTSIDGNGVQQKSLGGTKSITWTELRRIGVDRLSLDLYSSEAKIEIKMWQFRHAEAVHSFILKKWGRVGTNIVAISPTQDSPQPLPQVSAHLSADAMCPYQLVVGSESRRLPDLARNKWSLWHLPVIGVVSMGSVPIVLAVQFMMLEPSVPLIGWLIGPGLFGVMGAYYVAKWALDAWRQSTIQMDVQGVRQWSLRGERYASWAGLTRLLGNKDRFLLVFQGDESMEVYLPQFEHGTEVAEFLVSKWLSRSSASKF